MKDTDGKFPFFFISSRIFFLRDIKIKYQKWKEHQTTNKWKNDGKWSRNVGDRGKFLAKGKRKGRRI